MKRITAGILATGLLSLALSAPLSAQARGYVGFGGGISIPTGDYADGVKTGWLGQVTAGITGPNGRFGGRIDGMYVRHSFEGVDDAHSQLIGANADLVVTPGMMDAKIRPYLLGGIGIMNGKNKIAGVTSEGETKFSFNAGAGLLFKAGARMSVFVEGRWISIRTDDATNIVPITVGLRFGGQ